MSEKSTWENLDAKGKRVEIEWTRSQWDNLKAKISIMEGQLRSMREYAIEAQRNNQAAVDRSEQQLEDMQELSRQYKKLITGMCENQYEAIH